MPAPAVSGSSSTSVNVIWSQPTDQEVRGVVIRYSLYQLVTSSDPFAPPESSQVRLCLFFLFLFFLELFDKFLIHFWLNGLLR